MAINANVLKAHGVSARESLIIKDYTVRLQPQVEDGLHHAQAGAVPLHVKH